MAVRHELEIVIKPDGSITMGVKGADGPSCLDLTKALEDSLGEVVERERTPEFYLEETDQERIKTGG